MNPKDTTKINSGITEITLSAPSGIRMTLTNYGATLMRLQVPNSQGILTDVVIGLPRAEDYATPAYQKLNFCMGATIGRYAGRIFKGGFTLNTTFYPLGQEITLHGGKNGFDKQLWKVEEIQEGESPFALFSLDSKEGADGFPGNVKVFAKYQLVDRSLQISYTATTDAPTVLNLTNHSYFNLNGEGSVAGNRLYVNSQHILQTDERLIPTGRLLDVASTPYDYTQPTALEFEGHYGLDTPFVLGEGTLKASLYAPHAGIQMEVTTNQPAMVLFTPQDFPKMGLRNQTNFGHFPAICFECQNYPDAPNQSHFPSANLLPGEEYRNEISYLFN
ncbi:MAG: aldose epimerase family protein [Flavobacteriaceae bacterium]